MKKHPYMKVSFWEDTANHFWENGLFSDQAKEYFRAWVEHQVSDSNVIYKLR